MCYTLCATSNGMDPVFIAWDELNIAFSFLINLWWIYIPLLLLLGLMSAYGTYTKLKYISGLKWVLLKLNPPKDPGKSPKAAEHIFAALHGIYSPVKWKDKFFKGKVPDWFSFEIAGTQGEIHFYIRTPEQYKTLVQSQVYAQYPDSEITEVSDDYADWFPLVPDDKYDLLGSEFILNKEDVFPIRTYPEFEEKPSGPGDIKRVDPLASLSEVMSSLEAGENIAIQLLFRPTGDGWVKKGQGAIDKFQGKAPKVAQDFLGKTVWEIDKLIPGHVEVKKEEKKPESTKLTPGKEDSLKAIERKISKLGFESGIRFIYSGLRENFHKTHVSGVIGAFKQFSSPSLNGFKPNKKTGTSAKWPFKAQKEYKQKMFLSRKFKNRAFVSKPFVLNTEELASIYHFPDIGVKTPLMPRIEAKKGEPPSGLPIA